MKKMSISRMRSFLAGYDCSCGAHYENNFKGWLLMMAHSVLTSGQYIPSKDTYHYWM